MNSLAIARAAIALSLFALPACTSPGGPSALVPLQRVPSGEVRSQSWLSSSAAGSKSLLYVSNFVRSEIDIFSIDGAKGTLVGQISDPNGPSGLATDTAGNLYVADEGQEGDNNLFGAQIDMYAKGQTLPSRAIFPTYWDPQDVALDGSGTMYVANIARQTSFSPGSVTVYAKGASTPMRTLRYSNFQTYGIVIDAETHDLYVNYGTGSYTNVIRFPDGKAPGTVLNMHTANAWGLTEDAAHRLLVFDAPSNEIDVFSANGNKPLRQIPATSPQYGKFNAAGSLLYVSSFAGSVGVYAYPSGSLVGSIKAGDWNAQAWPVGVAVWPPAP